jgi:hypothetical protein
LAFELRHPEGRRARLGRLTDASESTNWSGLAGAGSDIEGAAGAWTVPAVEPSTAALYSCTWVGVDGLNNQTLIQTGTAQDTSNGSTSYYAWIEMLPANELEITYQNGSPALVEPGDQMVAYVLETDPSDNDWTIYIQDVTQNWFYEGDFYYLTPGASAEWIEEAPTVNNEQSTPADFGTAYFSGTEIYGDFGSSGTAWYSTDMDASNEIEMTNEAGTTILAMPSAPSASSSSGQSFSDTYVTAPGTPTDLIATPGVDSVYLSWQSPTDDGGTPIVGYYVQEYLSGTYQQTIYVTTTSTTVMGLTPSDAYSFSVAALSAGNWTSPYSATTSPVTVQGSQTITFTSTAPSSATMGGATYTVTATGGASGNPVTFSSATTSVCSVSGSVVSFIGAGTCTIDANQAGNTNYGAAAQVTQSFPVGQGSQTITFTSTAPSSATMGGATYTVTATGGASGNPVTFSSATTSVCSVSGSVVSFIGAGTCTIDANQAGNTNYGAAAQVTQSFPVGQGSQTITFTSTAPSSATMGGATYTVTATGGASDNPVTFSSATTSVCSVSGSVVSFIGAGTCTIDANQAGNTNYGAAAQVTQSFPVHPATTTTTLNVRTPLTYGDEGSATFHVTVTAPGLTPTGTVAIKNGPTALCTITLSSGKGSCTLSATKLAVGTYGLVAAYGGSTDFHGSASVKETLTVSKATTKTAVKLSATKVTYGHEQVLHLSVDVSPQFPGTMPTGTVTVKESTTTLCTIKLSSSKGSCTLLAKKLKAGTYQLVATYGGSANFKGSTSAKETLTVVK